VLKKLRINNNSCKENYARDLENTNTDFVTHFLDFLTRNFLTQNFWIFVTQNFWIFLTENFSLKFDFFGNLFVLKNLNPNNWAAFYVNF